MSGKAPPRVRRLSGPDLPGLPPGSEPTEPGPRRPAVAARNELEDLGQERLGFGNAKTVSEMGGARRAAPDPTGFSSASTEPVREALPRAPGLGRCGRYTLVERIKLGGMAEVFVARADGPEGFQKTVAIKRILPHLAVQQRFVQMFIDEAKLTVQLRHPGIAQVHELGRDGDTYFMAMEYVQGRDADWMFTAAQEAGVAIPLAAACHVMEQVLEGLDHAHRRVGPDRRPLNIIHRDVSPNNILIGHDGAVKLIDFGIAKAATNLQEATQQGVIKGKAAYMSPEQLKGEPLDHRTDVFAAGAVLHELLSGRRLFRGASDMETIRNVILAPIPAVTTLRTGLPRDIAAVVHRCLERDPARRFAWAGDAAAELRDAQVRHGLLDGRGELVRLIRQLGDATQA